MSKSSSDSGAAIGAVVDWDLLRSEARSVAARAYAPYSNFHVGAAGLTSNGRILTGCNVENASYGLTLCAECALVSALHSSGDGGRFVAVSCVSGTGASCTPCGRCRQLLFEQGGATCLIDTADGPVSISDLLPGAFGPDRLSEG